MTTQTTQTQKSLKFAKKFSKLDDDVFSTIRPRGKFVEGDLVLVEAPGMSPRKGRVRFVFERTIDQIPEEFLTRDTDTRDRAGAVAVLKGFYPNLRTDEIWSIIRVQYLDPPSIEARIRLDCYIAIMPSMKSSNPQAHFEVITRQNANSVLSPSWELLMSAKGGQITWEEYARLFVEEVRRRPAAIRRLAELKAIAARGTVLFLVCFEKDSTKCHRSLVKKMMLGEISI